MFAVPPPLLSLLWALLVRDFSTLALPEQMPSHNHTTLTPTEVQQEEELKDLIPTASVATAPGNFEVRLSVGSSHQKLSG